MKLGMLHQFPLGVWAVIFVAVLLISLETGYRLGHWKKNRQGGAEIANSRDIAMGSMFALLGLVVAFTYAFSVSRADTRKQAVANEANAIGTAFMRSELAPEPGRSELRQLLLDYALTRVMSTASFESQNVKKIMARTLEAKSKLWPATVRMVQDSSANPMKVSIVRAMNKVYDMHALRLRGVYDYLPGVVLLMLVFIAAASLAVAGFNAGLTGSMNRWRMTTFTVVLAAVMFIIIDFDVPQRGFIGVSQDPLVDVIDEMKASLSSRSTSKQP